MLHLKILTPEKAVYDGEVDKITCHTIDGEITILPKHTALLTLLTDGIITVVSKGKEEYFSAGSGYVETDGQAVRIMISEAMGQKELDEQKILEVKAAAEKLLKENVDQVDRSKAFAMLQRASIDLKVLGKLKLKK